MNDQLAIVSRGIRERLGENQTTFARRFGGTHSMISRRESGRAGYSRASLIILRLIATTPLEQAVIDAALR